MIKKRGLSPIFLGGQQEIAEVFKKQTGVH